MLQSKKILILALVIPILVLLGLVLKIEYQNYTATEVELPIHGYDPRDLLSGYYLTYTVDYGVKVCPEPNIYEAYVCLNPKQFSSSKLPDCKLYVHGTCRHGRFEAGVERFYASEFAAQDLQRTIQQQQPMSIVISVSEAGNAQVKYLMLNGKRWQVK